MGGRPCTCPAPHHSPEPASHALDKSHLLGPPPCSSIGKGDPPYEWENRGVFAVGGMGQRGLWVCGHLTSCLHPSLMCLSPMEAEGRLLRDAGVLRGSRDNVGTPLAREVAWAPKEPPGKSPALAPLAVVPSPGSCPGAWSHSPGPRFAPGECLLRTPRTGGLRCLHGEGGFEPWGTGVGGDHSPFSPSLAQTLES